MACIVPNCSCNVLKKLSSKSKNRSVFDGKSCNGCGHHSQLHRRFTSKDGLIIDELKAAITKPCSGLIPMSDLISNAMFDSYSLIPMSSYNQTNDQEVAVCTCTGFSNNDVSNVLLHFNKLSYDAVMEGLPSLPCDYCTHPLISHQLEKEVKDKYFSYEVIKDVAVELIDVISGDSHVTVCIIARNGDNQWRLKCELLESVSPEGTNGQASCRAARTKKRKIDELDRDFNKGIIERVKSIISNRHLAQLNLVKVPHYLSCTIIGEDVVIALGYPSTINVYSLCLGDQPSAVKLLNEMDLDHGMLTMLSAAGSKLCAGSSDGCIRLYQLPSSNEETSSIALSSFSINSCVWEDTGKSLFVGTEAGEVICYSLELGSVVYSASVCNGPVTAMCWVRESRSVAVGSTDGCVYIVSVIPTQQQSTDGPIKKYFSVTTKRTVKERICLTVTLQAHRSFIGSLCTSRQGFVVSCGWDGLLMIWPRLPIITGRSHDPVIEDEPNAIYKIGSQSATELLPISIRNITGDILMCVYRELNNKSTIVFYY